MPTFSGMQQECEKKTGNIAIWDKSANYGHIKAPYQGMKFISIAQFPL